MYSWCGCGIQWCGCGIQWDGSGIKWGGVVTHNRGYSEVVPRWVQNPIWPWSASVRVYRCTVDVVVVYSEVVWLYSEMVWLYTIVDTVRWCGYTRRCQGVITTHLCTQWAGCQGGCQTASEVEWKTDGRDIAWYSSGGGGKTVWDLLSMRRTLLVDFVIRNL